MEQFDLIKGIKKYAKEARWVLPSLALSVLATFVCFAVLILFWITSQELTLPVVFMCVFALCAVALFLRYNKNARHYYFYSYVDAFPDMSAPLNVLALNEYNGRLKAIAEEFGFFEIETSFLKTRQVYHLDVRAKAPNGALLSVVFEREKAVFYNLSQGMTKTFAYDEFLKNPNDDNAIIEDCLLLAILFGKEEIVDN